MCEVVVRTKVVSHYYPCLSANYRSSRRVFSGLTTTQMRENSHIIANDQAYKLRERATAFA